MFMDRVNFLFLYNKKNIFRTDSFLKQLGDPKVNQFLSHNREHLGMVTQKSCSLLKKGKDLLENEEDGDIILRK